MAPVGEGYFPPLDRCLSGSQQLWSWKLCLATLSHSNGPSDSLARFLGDPQTQDILLHPLNPYAKPSAQIHSTFETKTSAINASQSSNARYDIKQIKEDALWLSKESKIDEVSALRTTILAWQNRPASELLQSFTSLGNDSVNGQMQRRGSATAEKGDPELHQRRSRLAETLLSERCHVLKCSEYILAHLLCAPARSEIQQAKDHDVVSEIGQRLLVSWTPETSPKGKSPSHTKAFLIDAVDAIRHRLQGLTEGSQWTGLGAEQEGVEITWGMSQGIELVHIMQIMQDLLQARTTLASGEIILPWFRLMAECGFMQGFQLPYPGLESVYSLPIQSLVALVSLTFLDVAQTLDLLSQPSTLTSTTPSSTTSLPYIFNQAVTNELNDIIISIAPVPIASPAVMAWSIITQTIREMATSNRDNRETRLSIRAADKFGTGDSSDNEGYERPLTRGTSALRRTSSTSSNDSQQSTLIEEIYDSISITEIDDDPIAYLANNAAEDGKVFDVCATIARQYCTSFGYEHKYLSSQHMRSQLLSLIRACVNFVDYQPALLIATMAVVNGSSDHWDIVDQVASGHAGLATLLRQDNIMKEKIFLLALSRFPHETLPFLQICRALSNQDNERDSRYNIWVDLRELSIFTCMLPSNYQNYKNINEDAEIDYIELTEGFFFDLSAPSNPSTKRGLRYYDSYHHSRPGILIDRGCQGRVLSDGKPLVVGWHMPYSGLSYIGTLLQSASNGHISGDRPDSPITSDIVAEAIGFLSSLLQASVRGAKTNEDFESMNQTASSILGQASDGVDRNDDVISVVFQIFENELYKQRGGQEEEDPLNVLIACVQFTHALVSVMPDRVWPFLGRSGLLGQGEEGGRLSVIVSTYEIVGGRYDFLYGCIRLYDSLIEDVIRNAVARRTPSKALTRFGADSSYGSGVSESAMKKVLLNWQRITMDIFDSFRTFKYSDLSRRSEIGYWICTVFRKLINYSYCTQTNHGSGSNLTETLVPAASIVLDIFLSQSKSHLALDPLLQACREGLHTTHTSLPSSTTQHQVKETMAALQFIYSLIQAGIFLDRSSSHLSSHLFKEINLFIKLYAIEQQFKLPVADVIEALIRSASSSEQQPPSLLSHMGQHDARHFLELLSIFDRPVGDEALNVAIWRLLGSILSTRQQWFAHYILTGRTPSHQKKDQDQSPQIAEPMFNHALDGLSNIESLNPRRALAMLEFVVAAIDHWPHILQAVNDHPKFILAIPNFASSIKADDGRKVSNKNYMGIRMVALITDILAMYCRWTIQEGNTRFADEALKHLTSLAANTVVAPNYNASLHANLKQNFASKFPGCSLNDFRSTELRPPAMGDSFYYDFSLANSMLSYTSAWYGRTGKGFAGEIKRANINLSVVDAQVALFQSWKSLLFELSGPLAQSVKYQKTVAETIIECLRANTVNDLPESFFRRLAQSRADLSFTLLESLNRAKSTEPEVRGILSVAWNTLRTHNDDLGAAFSTEDANYHRMLIRILYLSLQIHTLDPTTSASDHNSAIARVSALNSTIPTILDVISNLVSNGFRSLTALLYESPRLVSPNDFHLLIAIFNTTLRIPTVPQQIAHLASLTSAQLSRSASALLSWSPSSGNDNTDDPTIFGEAALLFLLELSNVPPLAESLAVDATIASILTTPLLQAMQGRAFGPQDKPHRVFDIWTRALLPLFLNLLSSVGAPIAAEVAAALNTFPAQLQRASKAFTHTRQSAKSGRDAGSITLPVAQEAHSLALIVKVLDTFRAAGPSAGIESADVEEVRWDAQLVREDLEGWMARRAGLRERIVPGNEREEGWWRQKATKDGAETVLEEKIVKELKGALGVLAG